MPIVLTDACLACVLDWVPALGFARYVVEACPESVADPVAVLGLGNGQADPAVAEAGEATLAPKSAAPPAAAVAAAVA